MIHSFCSLVIALALLFVPLQVRAESRIVTCLKQQNWDMLFASTVFLGSCNLGTEKTPENRQWLTPKPSFDGIIKRVVGFLILILIQIGMERIEFAEARVGMR